MLALQDTSQVVRPRSKAAAPLLYLATLTVGLMTGFFFTFAVTIMPSLAKVDDRSFVTAFYAINDSAQGGLLFLVFLSAVVFTAAAAIVHHRVGARIAARWILTALVLYVLAVALTFVGNVPLNNKLAAADPAVFTDFAATRAAFDEGSWHAFNVARTIASILALLALMPAIALSGRVKKALKTDVS